MRSGNARCLRRRWWRRQEATASASDADFHLCRAGRSDHCARRDAAVLCDRELLRRQRAEPDRYGDVVVIEVNPNPSLAKTDDFAMSAAEAGLSYEALIQRILDNAMR